MASQVCIGVMVDVPFHFENRHVLPRLIEELGSSEIRCFVRMYGSVEVMEVTDHYFLDDEDGFSDSFPLPSLRILRELATSHSDSQCREYFSRFRTITFCLMYPLLSFEISSGLSPMSDPDPCHFIGQISQAIDWFISRGISSERITLGYTSWNSS